MLYVRTATRNTSGSDVVVVKSNYACVFHDLFDLVDDGQQYLAFKMKMNVVLMRRFTNQIKKALPEQPHVIQFKCDRMRKTVSLTQIYK